MFGNDGRLAVWHRAATMTLEEELEYTNTAIRNCLLAQSYSGAGKAKTMAPYADLCRRRDELLRQISEANTSSGSMCTVGRIERPM